MNLNTHFLRAQKYFVLVLNSVKPFCLSSEQGFKEKYIKQKLPNQQ